MIPSTIPFQTASTFVETLNVIGVALVVGYIAAFHQYKQADDPDIERTWRERATTIVVGFALYAVVVASFGPQETWVATVGASIDDNIQQFATELAVVGPQTESSTLSEHVLGTLKLLGLVVYILLFSVVSFSTAAANRVVQFVNNLF